MDSKRLIKLNLAEKLRKKAYRVGFFRARAQDEIAASIKSLRERREYSQVELAKLAGMKQSAVSRIEQAEYSSWTYKTLQRVAEALDAQMYVVFEPAEDVIARYEDMENFRSNGVVVKSFGKKTEELIYGEVGSNSISITQDSPSTTSGFLQQTEANTTGRGVYG